MISTLVERKVVKLGKYVSGPIFSNEFQWLTLDCGHKGKYTNGLAAWRVGDTCYCDHCGEIKKKAVKKVRKEVERALKKVLKKRSMKEVREEIGKEIARAFRGFGNLHIQI